MEEVREARMVDRAMGVNADMMCGLCMGTQGRKGEWKYRLVAIYGTGKDEFSIDLA